MGIVIYKQLVVLSFDYKNISSAYLAVFLIELYADVASVGLLGHLT